MIDSKAATLAAIQGNPAGVLWALLFYPDRSLGESQLAALCNRSRKTIRAGLATLETLGLAQRHARYHGWTTTALVRQLILGEDATPNDGQLLPLPPSCSEHPSNPIPSPYLTTTTTNDGQLLPLPDKGWRELQRLLTHNCASTPKAAQLAIRHAHARGESQDETRYQILAWLSYSLSEDGTGINNRGAFIAKQIRLGIPCPDWHTPHLDGSLGRELRHLLYPEIVT